MKKVPYFSHDADARRDPKIVALIAKHGLAGYGAFWVIIEILREQEKYSLPCKEFAYTAIGSEIAKPAAEAKNFVNALVKEFELLQTDEKFFWSESLNRRMLIMAQKTDQAKKAAEKRWEKERRKGNAGA